MTETPGPRSGAADAPAPGERRPRRLLDQAPGDRISTRAAAAAAASAALAAGDPARRRASLLRAAGFGLVAASAGLAAYLVAALALLWVGLLLVVAVTEGYLVGVFTSYGAGTDAGTAGPGARRAIGILLACGVVVAGLAIAWAASGRYLDPLEFAGQVYGLTVPLQLAGAAAGALVGTR
jgi:hypothetical protein